MKNKFADTIANKTKMALGSNLISLEAIKQNIIILDEIKNFIPPLNPDEFTQLEVNLLANGCKDSLLLWETTKDKIGQESTEPAYVLIDGHNRFQICRKHNLNYNIQLLQFQTLKEVKDHMIDLQLGRRNLTPQQTSYFRGLRYNNEKVERGKYDREEHKGQDVPYEKNSASERLAKEFSVSSKTIKRDAEFATGLDKLDSNLRNQILAGNAQIDKAIIQKLSKIDTTIPIQTVDEIERYILKAPENSVKKLSEDELKNQLSLLVEVTKKLAKSKDKNHLLEIKNIIRQIEIVL